MTLALAGLPLGFSVWPGFHGGRRFANWLGLWFRFTQVSLRGQEISVMQPRRLIVAGNHESDCVFAASTIAVMPALTGSGSVDQASSSRASRGADEPFSCPRVALSVARDPSVFDNLLFRVDLQPNGGGLRNHRLQVRFLSGGLVNEDEPARIAVVCRRLCCQVISGRRCCSTWQMSSVVRLGLRCANRLRPIDHG